MPRPPALGALMLAFSALTSAADPNAPAAPPELGRVAWLRDFDAALKAAATEKKPIFLLFQEIPGCATCKNYGSEVLSHPLLVEAIESEFIPVAIRNNTTGDSEERILKSFHEPAWNNPVARLITPDRKDLVPRLDGVYSVDGVALHMIDALSAVHRPVPEYLRLVAAEAAARRRGLERATFGMHCFWEGEVRLGELDGVFQTRPGFVGGAEVVEVEFDQRTIGYEALVDKARSLECATRVFARTESQLSSLRSMARAGKLPESTITRSDEPARPDKEPKYYLSKSPLRTVPITELQACRVNAAVARNRDAMALLSPRQRALAEQHNRAGAKAENRIGVDLRTCELKAPPSN
ncbi:MAG: VPGUxxT family thioredoxin-like (seleno)protein, type 2 [Phycisphaerae bacterium]|nr:VPGUxxT family thioredoxin-like (seleno)protein, type 2 [Phycisphaerae bacterium]